MVEMELPHEEHTKRYCPRLCPYSNHFGDTPCILNEDLDEPAILEGRNFQCDKDCEQTAADIQEHATKFINSPLQKVTGVVKQNTFVQVYFRHNVCPLWAMREVYGDDWQSWFEGGISIEPGVVNYPLRDPLLEPQLEIAKKLKEKKVKKDA